MKKLLLLAALVLTLPLMAQDEEWRWSQSIQQSTSGYYSPDAYPDVKAIRTPQSIAEVIAALPAFPSVENIYCEEAKDKALRATYIPFEKALNAALLQNGKRSQETDRQMKSFGDKQQKVNEKAMEQYNANVNAGLMPSQDEIMQLYMSGEIKQNMSDAQMMDVMASKFASKWGVSKQEYLKIINMAQSNPKGCENYLKSNHPDLYKRLYTTNAAYGNTNVHPDDPRDAQFARISDQITEVESQLNEVLGVYSGAVRENVQKLNDLRAQMDADWKTCSEAKQIDAIAEALEKRLDAWYPTIKVVGDVPFPAWWTAERKKMNGLVDQWNRRWAAKWIKDSQAGDAQLRSLMKRAAELETENEALGKQGSQENFQYLMNKKRMSSIFAYLPQATNSFNEAFGFPCREHVEETGGIVREK